MTRVAIVSVLASWFAVLAPGPASAIVDRDCGDFASQRAAQIFFLNHGGPNRDPHGLDADGDGIACESNPCPCLNSTHVPGGGGGGGSTPPPKPPPIKSRVTLELSRPKAIPGETVRLTADVAPNIKRRVVLQRRAGDRWLKVASATTGADGLHVFRRATPPQATKFRVVTPKTRKADQRYASATSDSVRLSSQGQSVMLTVPTSVERTDDATAVVDARPVREGRAVTLQVRSGGSWVDLDEGVEDSGGETQFGLTTSDIGKSRYRAVVEASKGAAAVTSAAHTVEVSDTTAPAQPTGLGATPGDGQVHLQWSPTVAADDVAGWIVYQGTSSDGPWTRLTVDPVSTTSYDVAGLTNGQEYWFTVTVIDDAGNESPQPTAVAGTPQSADPVN